MELPEFSRRLAGAGCRARRRTVGSAYPAPGPSSHRARTPPCSSTSARTRGAPGWRSQRRRAQTAGVATTSSARAHAHLARRAALRDRDAAHHRHRRQPRTCRRTGGALPDPVPNPRRQAPGTRGRPAGGGRAVAAAAARVRDALDAAADAATESDVRDLLHATARSRPTRRCCRDAPGPRPRRAPGARASRVGGRRRGRPPASRRWAGTSPSASPTCRACATGSWPTDRAAVPGIPDRADPFVLVAAGPRPGRNRDAGPQRLRRDGDRGGRADLAHRDPGARARHPRGGRRRRGARYPGGDGGAHRRGDGNGAARSARRGAARRRPRRSPPSTEPGRSPTARRSRCSRTSAARPTRSPRPRRRRRASACSAPSSASSTAPRSPRSPSRSPPTGACSRPSPGGRSWCARWTPEATSRSRSRPRPTRRTRPWACAGCASPGSTRRCWSTSSTAIAEAAAARPRRRVEVMAPMVATVDEARGFAAACARRGDRARGRHDRDAGRGAAGRGAVRTWSTSSASAPTTSPSTRWPPTGCPRRSARSTTRGSRRCCA